MPKIPKSCRFWGSLFGTTLSGIGTTIYFADDFGKTCHSTTASILDFISNSMITIPDITAKLGKESLRLTNITFPVSELFSGILDELNKLPETAETICSGAILTVGIGFSLALTLAAWGFYSTLSKNKQPEPNLSLNTALLPNDELKIQSRLSI